MCLGAYTGKVGIAAQALRRAVDTHVNNHRALTHHVARDAAGPAHGKKQKIGLTALLGKVGRARMAYGHSGIAKAARTGQQHGQRLAHNVGTPHNHGLFAAGGQVVTAQQLHDASGRARNIPRQTKRKPPHAHRMEAVHVLFRINGQQAFLRVEPLGQGQLQQNAVHVGVGVALADKIEQFLLGGRGRQVVGKGNNTGLGAGALFVAHIDLRGGVFTHKNNRKARRTMPLGSGGGHFRAKFCADIGGCFFAVNQNHDELRKYDGRPKQGDRRSRPVRRSLVNPRTSIGGCTRVGGPCAISGTKAHKPRQV